MRTEAHPSRDRKQYRKVQKVRMTIMINVTLFPHPNPALSSCIHLNLLLSHWYSLYSALAVTSLHVAVLAERRATSVPGFVPKQSFRLRLPKSKRDNNQTHHLCISGGNPAPIPVPEAFSSSSPSSPQEANSEGSATQQEKQASQAHGNQDPEPWFRQKNLAFAPNLIWYTFDKPIAGFSGAI